MSAVVSMSVVCKSANVVLQNVDVESGEQMYRVVLPDGSEVSLQVSAGHTVGTVLDKLSSRLQCGLEFVDAVVTDTNEVD